MARYKITWTFFDNPLDGDNIGWTDTATNIIMVYLNTTSAPNHIPIDSNVYNTVSATYGVFQQLYNLQGKYLNSLNGLEWSVEGEFIQEPTITNVPSNAAVVVDQVEQPLSITSIQFQTNVSNPCNLIDIVVTANKVFDEIISPVAATFADTLTYTITGQPRNKLTQFLIVDSLDQQAQSSAWSPSYLNEGLLSVSVAEGSVVINNTTSGLTLEYSLDNAIWQTSNAFNGLGNGDYTCWVRDQFDCKTSITFTVAIGGDGTITIPDPYFFYSDANPLRIAERVDWNGCDVVKNDYNTLSCESTDGVVHTERQRWRTCDVINLQVRNNYSDLVIETSDGDILDLEQKTNNLNQKNALDGKTVKLSDTAVGVYFISGQTYNYDTLDPIGSHTLNGTLPQWAIIGNIITIGAFNYQIVDVSYNEDLAVDQAVIASGLEDGDQIIKAIYNAFDYEVYEVALPLLNKTEPFNLEFSYGGQLRYTSELIYPDDYTQRLARIQYYMDYNTDMFWATGIQPVIRLRLDKDNASPKRETTQYETDTTSEQTKANNYRMNVFKFLPVTKQLARNCMTIFSCSNIDINGVEYTCEGIEMEPLEDSNLYVLTATMQEKGSGLARDNTGSFVVTLPNLVKTNQGYIKI